jgi:hypothetical protein
VTTEPLHAWEFDRDIGLEVAARVALDQLEPPDLELVLIATRGDVITVQIVEGTLADPASALYVASRGLYEILRTELWPPVTAGGEPRVLLTLRAWPNA